MTSGRMLRPKRSVLPASALIPAANVLQPPPNRFTHKVAAPQPYWFALPPDEAHADGLFEAGTPVVLLHHDGGVLCRVADGRGLYVLTRLDGLSARRTRVP